MNDSLLCQLLNPCETIRLIFFSVFVHVPLQHQNVVSKRSQGNY